MLLHSELLPPKWVHWVTTTLESLRPMSEQDISPMWNPAPTIMETGSVKLPFSDPGYELGDDMSSVISQHSHQSAYPEIKDWCLKKRKNWLVRPGDKLAQKQEADKPGHLCALWKICKGLIIKADGVKDFMEVAEETEMKDLPSLPSDMLLSHLLSHTRSSMQPKAPSTPRTVKQCIQIMLNEWLEKMQAGEHLSYQHLAI